MTQPNRAPKLYVTSEFLEEARDEGVTGATAHASAHDLMNRASQGRLRGLSVSRLLLHTSTKIDDVKLKVYRVVPHESGVTQFEASNRPGTHPHAFIESGMPEVHALVVPVKEFEPMAAAWSLHNAAARYADELGLPAAGEEELRAPTEGFGVAGLDQALDFGLQMLGGMISRAQPEDRRESPESLAAKLREGINPTLGRGVDAIRAVQGLPNDPNAAVPQPAMTPNEMAQFVEQRPPIVFHEK